MRGRFYDPVPIEWIRGLGMLNADLAEACGVLPRQANRWRNGTCQPTGDHRRRLMILLVERGVLNADLEFVPRPPAKQRRPRIKPRVTFSGPRVRRLLKRLKWSCKRAGTLSPFSLSQWSNWQRGKTKPSSSAALILEAMERWALSDPQVTGKIVVEVKAAGYGASGVVTSDSQP